MSKTQKAIAKKRADLIAAIDRACIARAEAQWMNGYRTGRLKYDARDSDGLSEKEAALWAKCGPAEVRAHRAVAAYALAIRRSFDPIKRTSGRGRTVAARKPK